MGSMYLCCPLVATILCTAPLTGTRRWPLLLHQLPDETEAQSKRCLLSQSFRRFPLVGSSLGFCYIRSGFGGIGGGYIMRDYTMFILETEGDRRHGSWQNSCFPVPRHHMPTRPSSRNLAVPCGVRWAGPSQPGRFRPRRRANRECRV